MPDGLSAQQMAQNALEDEFGEESAKEISFIISSIEQNNADASLVNDVLKKEADDLGAQRSSLLADQLAKATRSTGDNDDLVFNVVTHVLP